MSEIQKHILELREQLFRISNNMNQLSEISKKIPPEDKEKMKPICDAMQKSTKKALEIIKEISELNK